MLPDTVSVTALFSLFFVRISYIKGKLDLVCIDL